MGSLLSGLFIFGQFFFWGEPLNFVELGVFFVQLRAIAIWLR